MGGGRSKRGSQANGVRSKFRKTLCSERATPERNFALTPFASFPARVRLPVLCVRRVTCTHLAARARACAMGMRPGHRPLRGSMCSTQNWGLACERLIQVVYPIFPCFQPDILIGAHTHGTHSGASMRGSAGRGDALRWRAVLTVCSDRL